MNLRIAVGLGALSMLICASDVFAAPAILICQPSNSAYPPFQMTVDSDRGIVEVPNNNATQVNITDTKITFRLINITSPAGSTAYRDAMLDRVTAVYSDRPCDSAQGVCGPWYISQCRKGEKQF